MLQDWDDETPRHGGLRESWAAVLRDMRSLAIDLTLAGTQVARLVPMPPIDQLVLGWTRIEDVLLRELKHRLDELEARSGSRAHALTSGGQRPTPAQLLERLLGASIEADAGWSRDELYRSLLLRLVPDEARILAALADGTPYPLVHVQSRAQGITVLANASTVGRAAGVQVPDAVGTYVTHLRALGLAEEGAADDELGVQYDILLGEPGVRNAEEEAKSHGRLGARVVRRTLRISALGRELWRACRPEDDAELAARFGDAVPGEALDVDGVAPLAKSAVPGPAFRPDTAYRPSVNGSQANQPDKPAEDFGTSTQGSHAAGSAGELR